MTSREQRTRELLDAAASSRRVDAEGLWRRVESQLDQPSRRTRRNRGALLAAAAAAAVAGAAIWAGGFEPTPAPSAPSTSPTVTSLPSPTDTPTAALTTSTPTTSAPTTKAPTTPTQEASSPSTAARGALSTASVLTARDYRATGWVVDSVTRSAGWGQAPISTCQTGIPPSPDVGWPVYRGDGRATVPGRQLVTAQYAVELPTVAEARQLVSDVIAWPEGCDARAQQSVEVRVATQTVALPDGREGHWSVIHTVQGSGFEYHELVAVTRDEERVALVVLTEYTGTEQLAGVDVTSLLSRAVARLR